MSTADGALVLQWGDTGTADHLWTAIVDTGGYLRFRNSNSQKVLGVENAATAAGSRLLQWSDNGAGRPPLAVAVRLQRRLPHPVRATAAGSSA